MCQIVHNIFQDQIHQNHISIYVDDVFCYSKTFSQHLTRLEALLKRMDEYNFGIKSSKTSFFYTHLDILGFRVESNKAQPSKKNVEAIFRSVSYTHLTLPTIYSV